MLRKTGLLLSVAILMSSCASLKLEPQAQLVQVTPNPPSKDCRYVGQVIGNQGNFFTGPWTSNKNLEQGAINDMRNQAAKLGANYIQIITTRAGNTGSYNGTSGDFSQTNVTYNGNAYFCRNLH